MRHVFYPDGQKLITVVVILGVVLSSLALRAIPVQIDIFDLREVPELVVFVFGRLPIEVFDLMTSQAFAPQGEGFLVFPTLPQIGFAMLLDLAVIYVVSCLVCHYWRRSKQSLS